jgi:hypothetical protein
MIQPDRITNYNRTAAELQEFLLFCICVHGKNANVQALKLHHFLEYLAHLTGQSQPFDMVNVARNFEEDDTGETLLDSALRKFKVGQYSRITQAIDDLLTLSDLRTVTVQELESCFAVGPKTARFFIVHSRPSKEYAILDTHILKWMGVQGVEGVPKNTPQGKWYSHFEKIFLTMVEKSGLTVAEFDLNIWKTYARI